MKKVKYIGGISGGSWASAGECVYICVYVYMYVCEKEAQALQVSRYIYIDIKGTISLGGWDLRGL